MIKLKLQAIWRLPVFILAVSLFLSGCGKEVAKGKEIVAYVNKDVIYKDDLDRDIALRAKLDPSFKLTKESEAEQLDQMIDRKVIVQYAMEKGMARDERFVNTIRTIWEHTLIRDFIESKKRGMQDYLFATSEDVLKYYNNMSYKATFKVFKSTSKKAADEAYAKYLKDKDTSGWQTAGPMAYDDIGMVPILDAFEMERGEATRFTDDPNYYIIELSEKDKVEPPPLETIKADLEKRVIAMKEKRLFENWLKERKKSSKIIIKDQPL